MSTEQTLSQDQEIRLSILGMRCAGCIAAVETALQSVTGVESVNVNFADHSAVVIGNADPDMLKSSLKEAGYDAAVMEGLEDPSDEERQEEERYRSLMRKAAVAAILGVPLMLGAHLDWFPLMGTPEGTGFWTKVSLLTLFVLFYSGGHFFVGAIKLLQVRQANMDTLIALGYIHLL